MVLRHFSNAGLLRAVEPLHLMELLERHADYFAARGVDIGTNGDGLDYDAIAHVLMTPDERTPNALIDDLHFIDEMATPDSMDAMLDAAHAADLDIGTDPTPTDVAVRLRRCKPELLEQIHAEQCLLRHLRTFEYFQSKSESDITYRTPDVHKQRAFENALGSRLEAMKRGRACQLCLFPRRDGVWFLVRRGDTRLHDKTTPCRPEKYDVLKYDARRGELLVNAHNHGKLIAIYRELFGELLFDDPLHFEAVPKYVLDPLQSAGPDALICSDVDGVHCITLREVQICWSGAHGEVEIRRASDLFRALKTRRMDLPNGRIVKASFLIYFTDAKVPRAVVIHRGNVASYTRDLDVAVVEQWLTRRGFVRIQARHVGGHGCNLREGGRAEARAESGPFSGVPFCPPPKTHAVPSSRSRSNAVAFSDSRPVVTARSGSLRASGASHTSQPGGLPYLV